MDGIYQEKCGCSMVMLVYGRVTKRKNEKKIDEKKAAAVSKIGDIIFLLVWCQKQDFTCEFHLGYLLPFLPQSW